MAYVNPTTVAIPTDGFEQLPVDIARQVGAVVLSSLGDGVTVGMGDPLNTKQVESLGKILGKNVSPVFAHPDEIATVIDMYLGSEGNMAVNLQSVCDQLPGMIGAREIKTAADVADLVESKAVIELLNSIILTAYRRRASDIHFETRAEDSRVRMRIDGDMQTVMELPRTVHVTLVVRIKVLCQLDLSQSRLPQDGAFELNFGTLNTAFRVSTLPSLYGEKAVLARPRLAARPVHAEPGQSRLSALDARRDQARRIAPQRHPHRLRPDGQRQDHDALRLHQRAQPPRPQHHHDRGPGGIPSARHHAAPGQRRHRPDLRQGAPQHHAAGSRCHPHRRNPRPGDRAHRHRGGADRGISC